MTRAPAERGEEWFTALYSDHRSDVVRYALRSLSDMDAAMDLAQEVFVVAWRRRGDVPDRGLPWLYGVARKLLANHWRSRRSAPEMRQLVAEGVAQPSAVGVDRLTDARAAMTTLPEPDREILRLIGWEGLELAEAAVVLGCRRATAAVRLHQARRRLERAMDSVPSRGSSPSRRRPRSDVDLSLDPMWREKNRV